MRIRKLLLEAYALVGIFVIPVIIGTGVADFLLQGFVNYGHHWIAGAVVCLIAGAVGSWLPLLVLAFLVDGARFWKRMQISIAAFVGFAGGVVGPLVLGFSQLGLIISGVIILSTLMTVQALVEEINEALRHLQQLEDKERSQPEAGGYRL